eukprot:793519-Rhodomonas_salina.2
MERSSRSSTGSQPWATGGLGRGPGPASGNGTRRTDRHCPSVWTLRAHSQPEAEALRQCKRRSKREGGGRKEGREVRATRKAGSEGEREGEERAWETVTVLPVKAKSSTEPKARLQVAVGHDSCHVRHHVTPRAPRPTS